MFEKNGHNPSCGYAGDIVAYLYNEIDSAEKLKFESHLGGCTACGHELAAFSDVRSSVIDWRTEEFGWLPSPQIVIPYEAVEESPVVVEVARRSTILTDFKRFFSFAPWPPAFAAFGALAVLAGLAFFAVSYVNQGSPDLADNRKAGQPVTAATVEARKDPEKNEIAEANNTNTAPGAKSAVVPEKGLTPDNGPQKIAVVTTAPKDRGVPAPKDPKAANKPGEKNATQDKQKAPSLNSYTEDEDTTLRLADLFEEVDTRE